MVHDTLNLYQEREVLERKNIQVTSPEGLVRKLENAFRQCLSLYAGRKEKDKAEVAEENVTK